MGSAKARTSTIDPDGYAQVDKLPRNPEQQASYWLNSQNRRFEYTHQLFRFPAKFHPPVVRWALGKYGRNGSTMLDPFTGSGSVQVEALTRGISSIGIDVDPLACYVARAKTTPLDPKRLEKALGEIQKQLEPYVGLHADREVRRGADISIKRFAKEARDVVVPPIANISHWFRRYVIVDLSRILAALDDAPLSGGERRFFRACAAATIRRVSNADPTPVSGLEVTSIQEKKNRTRKIRVFDEFYARVMFGIRGMAQLWTHWRALRSRPRARVIHGDVIGHRDGLQALLRRKGDFPLVITSPPYCSAVEYSRRHRLEMFWLGFVADQAEHVELTHSYIGRPRVRASDWDDRPESGVATLERTLDQIERRDVHSARAVRFYFFAMSRFIDSLADVIRRRGTFVCIIGDSLCSRVRVPTADFVAELATGRFRLVNRFSYAIRNHYMQYALRNGEGIKQEHVLVFKPR